MIAFVSKVITSLDTALPPDVRRRLCPAVTVLFLVLGYATFSDLPRILPEARTPGHSPRIQLNDSYGGAEPPPHIRRQSRHAGSAMTLEASQ